MQGYGFEVLAPGDEYSGGYWTVQLPHSCDEWIITSSKDQGMAVTQLQQFIHEAQAALGQLQTRIRTEQNSAKR